MLSTAASIGCGIRQACPVHPSNLGRCSPKSQRPAVPRPCPRAARSRASSRPTIRYVRQVGPEPGPLMGHSVDRRIPTCGRAGVGTCQGPGRPRALGRPRGGVPASDRCQARGVCPGAGRGRCRPGPLRRPSALFAESPRCSCGRGDFEFMKSSESSVIRGTNVRNRREHLSARGRCPRRLQQGASSKGKPPVIRPWGNQSAAGIE